MATLVLCSVPSSSVHMRMLYETSDSCYKGQSICMNLRPTVKCPLLASISRVSEALSKICSVSINNAALSKSMLHIHELQRNITKDYRKLVVNKFYDTILLTDGCMCFEVGGQAANANWDLAGCSNQPLRSTMRAWGHRRIRTDSGHVSNCRVRSVPHPTTTKSWQRI
jgi:hypothetical protein